MTARRATYPSARKLAVLTLMLAARTEDGIDTRAIGDELGVSPRTVLRYLAILRAEFGMHLEHAGHRLALRPGWEVAFGGAL